MKFKNLLFAFLVIGLIYSCKEDKKSETLSQMKQVMNMHDEVMPKMGAMAKLAGELSSKEDSTATGMQYKAARKDLQAAQTCTASVWRSCVCTNARPVNGAVGAKLRTISTSTVHVCCKHLRHGVWP